MSDAGGTISVEIAYASPDDQHLVTVDLPADATLGNAVEFAISNYHEFADVEGLSTGIWGKLADPDTPLGDGDRVEFYRPLKIDPREARRRHAAAGLAMNTPGRRGNAP